MNKKKNKNVSSIIDHKLYKKKGILSTPFNDKLGELLKFSSWQKERMPDYLWLGLILRYYGRQEGFERSGKILFEISKKINSLNYPKLSLIFALPIEEQQIIYNIISENIDEIVLSPLTILYQSNQYPLFNKYFNYLEISFESRLNELTNAIELYLPPQSNEATDLRFLALSLLMFNGKIHVAQGLVNSSNALREYAYTSHDDERMKSYRPFIRCFEGVDFEDSNSKFSQKFWSEIGMITKCKPMVISFNKNEKNYKQEIKRYKDILTYVISAYKEKSLSDDRFQVIVGSITYALKIFTEVFENSLGNSILGRHAIRTIIEIYIILKYLLKLEKSKTGVWLEYKLYGISKYKLILLKERESDVPESSHFKSPIIDLIVNEIMWEEFIDIDLKYFDKAGIREKSISVNEKKLYDIYYDYDSSFAHGLWGAVRESAMLQCDNSAHEYHSVPDIYMNQNSSEVITDCHENIKKLFSILKDCYDFPENFKIGDDHNES